MILRVIGTNLNNYQKALELADSGQYQQALVHIQEHLNTVPNDAQVLNDAGAILHCLERSDEAIEFFVKAKGFQNNSAEIIWNLVEAYLTVGRPGEVVSLFDEMQQLGILNADVLNRTANVFLKQGDKAGAIETLLRSLLILPGQKVL
jgi:pentatricopeptide repeat protein